MRKLSLLLLRGITLSRSTKQKPPLSEAQRSILRFAFRLRIEAMKKGKLDMDLYVESGKFNDDLDDAGIDHNMNAEEFQIVDRIFKDELVKASFNPKMYEL